MAIIVLYNFERSILIIKLGLNAKKNGEGIE